MDYDQVFGFVKVFCLKLGQNNYELWKNDWNIDKENINSFPKTTKSIKLPILVMN